MSTVVLSPRMVRLDTVALSRDQCGECDRRRDRQNSDGHSVDGTAAGQGAASRCVESRVQTDEQDSAPPGL